MLLADGEHSDVLVLFWPLWLLAAFAVLFSKLAWFMVSSKTTYKELLAWVQSVVLKLASDLCSTLINDVCPLCLWLIQMFLLFHGMQCVEHVSFRSWGPAATQAAGLGSDSGRQRPCFTPDLWMHPNREWVLVEATRWPPSTYTTLSSASGMPTPAKLEFSFPQRLWQPGSH